MELDKNQLVILETVHSRNGECNWYKVSRRVLSLLDSPAELKLSPLLDAGLIEESSLDGEPLPRLHVTAKGKQVLAEQTANQTPRA